MHVSVRPVEVPRVGVVGAPRRPWVGEVVFPGGGNFRSEVEYVKRLHKKLFSEIDVGDLEDVPDAEAADLQPTARMPCFVPSRSWRRNARSSKESWRNRKRTSKLCCH